MNIQPILDRLEQPAPARPDLAALRRLHRAWRTRVPYENLDHQLGREISIDPKFLVNKFGPRRRGSSCFQMNGALSLLLRGVGFTVTVIEGAVSRREPSPEDWGNHIALFVEIDGQPWLADVGIGDSFLEPLPLMAGTHRQGALEYRLEQLSDRKWRVHHHPGGTIRSYDIDTTPRRLDEFTANAQTSHPVIYQVLLAQHHHEGRELALRSRVFSVTDSSGRQRRVLRDLDEFTDALGRLAINVDDFGPGTISGLWDKTESQYETWLAMERRPR